jgi:hypothetical protein
MHRKKWTPEENGLYNSDRLTFEEHSTSLPCPAWAASNEKLKQVVVAKLLRKAKMGAVLNYVPVIPTNLDFLRALEIQSQEQVRKHEHLKEWRTHHEAAARHGGPAALLTAIAWRRFRLGQTSPVIAESLGISPQVVRRHASSLAEIARQLYADPALHLPRNHRSKIVTRPFFAPRVFSAAAKANMSAAAKASWQRRKALTPIGNTGDTFNGKPTQASV